MQREVPVDWRQPFVAEQRATWGQRRFRGPLVLAAAAATEPVAGQVASAAELLAIVAAVVWQLDSLQPPVAAAAWVAPRHPRR